MKKKEKNDFTLSVIKSLKPIKFSYSKQSKEYEKYFSGSNLKFLLKSIKKKTKGTNIFNKYALIPNKSNDNLVNIKIKSSFNCINDLSSLNNFPLRMIKQRKNYEEYLKKMHLFNELFYVTKEKLVDFEFRKKRGERIKKKFEHQLINDDSKTTLDPGKYYPKYSLIHKRNPVAYLGVDKEKKNNCKTKYKTIISERINNNTIIKSRNKNNDKNINKNISDPTFYLSRNKKNYFKDKECKEEGKKIFTKFHKINKNSTLKKYSSVSNSLYFEKQKTFEIDNNKAFNNMFQSAFIINNKNTYNKNKINLKNNFKTAYSLENVNKIKCPIVFNKMPGRDRSAVIEPSPNEDGYTPNFESTRPHVPSTIFRRTFDFQKFKRYMTGKIIRNYCYTPDKYFVLEVNKNQSSCKNLISTNHTYC